jgi:hypothetical protein
LQVLHVRLRLYGCAFKISTLLQFLLLQLHPRGVVCGLSELLANTLERLLARAKVVRALLLLGLKFRPERLSFTGLRKYALAADVGDGQRGTWSDSLPSHNRCNEAADDE